MNQPQDLHDRLEKMIDLPAFLGQRGYEAVAHANDSDGVTMTNRATGEMLLVRRETERGGWTYSNPVQPSDRGAVTDFLEKRDDIDRQGCLAILIACTDARRVDIPEAVLYRAYVREKPEPLKEAEREHLRALDRERAATNLLGRFGIDRSSLDESRFGAFRSEEQVLRAATEPERLWSSRYRPSDKSLVLTERPIDGISLEQSRGDMSACYVAVGSQLDDSKQRRLAHVLAELPSDTKVVLAFGAGQRGDRLALEIKALAPTVKMQRLAPDFGLRWNDQIQLEQRHQRSIARVAGLSR